MGIGDNRTSLGLAEDFAQLDDLDGARVDDILQNISGPHRGELVHIPHEDDHRLIGDRLEQVVDKQDVHHGGFVNDQHVTFQGIIRISLVARIGFVLQQAVDGPCFRSGRKTNRNCPPNFKESPAA